MPDTPFLCYLATGVVHAPDQAPAGYIEAYRGRFDDGWEAWRERAFARQVDRRGARGDDADRAPELGARWDDPPADQRRLYARIQEVFAGFVTHTDPHIGRCRTSYEATGPLHDTLVLAISDNGTSGEGGPTGSCNEHRFPTTASTTSPTRSPASTSWAATAPTTTTPGGGRGPATRRSGSGSATPGWAGCGRHSSRTGRGRRRRGRG